MKVLFLDIDGVLNSIEYSVSQSFVAPTHRIDEVDPAKVGLLRFICENTDAKIVISSTWRIGRAVPWFVGFFAAHGWPLAPVHSVTPQLNGIRGDEINEWFDFGPGQSVTTYAIVDDDSDFHDDQPLVQTNGVYGLTLKETIALIDILGVSDTANTKRIEHLRQYVDFK
jgi:hypothetical protein